MTTPVQFGSSDFVPDRLLAGDADDLVTRKVTLVAGQTLVRGAVLGIITASGKYTLSASAAADGSQAPDSILAQDCDATAADAECLIYERGTFNEGAVTLGAGHTVASIHQ